MGAGSSPRQLGKGEIAHSELFLVRSNSTFPPNLLSPCVFKTCKKKPLWSQDSLVVCDSEKNHQNKGEIILTHSQTTNFTLPKSKSVQTTIINLMKMAENA